MKKNNFFKTLIFGTMIFYSFLKGQCAAPANIFAFSANGKNYELVREKNDWVEAFECAVQRGGYLAEINSQAEQNAIFQQLQSTAAGINLAETTAQDGGGASYVWLGAMMVTGNEWKWDGNADGTGILFWEGGSETNGGQPLNNAYTHWGSVPGGAPTGVEPDNLYNAQEVLALGLTSWPNGSAGQWNDLSSSNELYYVIEMNNTLGIDDLKSETGSVQLYPNAVKDVLHIKTMKSMTGIALTDASGRKVKSVSVNGTINEKVDCVTLADGVYFVEIVYQDKTSTRHKILKIHQ